MTRKRPIPGLLGPLVLVCVSLLVGPGCPEPDDFDTGDDDDDDDDTGDDDTADDDTADDDTADDDTTDVMPADDDTDDVETGGGCNCRSDIAGTSACPLALLLVGLALVLRRRS